MIKVEANCYFQTPAAAYLAGFLFELEAEQETTTKGHNTKQYWSPYMKFSVLIFLNWGFSFDNGFLM